MDPLKLENQQSSGYGVGRGQPQVPATCHIPFRYKFRFSQAPTCSHQGWRGRLLRTRKGPLSTASDLFFLPPALKPSEQKEMKPENLFLHLHEGENPLPKN